ncbi:amidophosphoribosyltransferase [bacterium]|nr:amidophosphoribosyltransferase [bacterium]MBU1073811.1 amidophosphoribosyltransferase [bacterium]MBU1675701.1 amidophosphoribosyltransferase [bacterium]
MAAEGHHWRDECGVVGIAGCPGAGELSVLALHALQHRGQESAGVSVSDGHAVSTYRRMGLVADIFTEDVVKKLGGTFSIGHVRYSTTGTSRVENAQPMQVTCHRGAVAVAHNGNLVNAHVLRRGMELEGSIFGTTCDTEVFLHLIARSRTGTFEDAVSGALQQVEGAYSLLVLTRDKLIAVRDPLGFRPLCLGRFKDSYLVASESCAFDIIGGAYLRDVEPGEMVILDGNGLVSRRLAPKGRITQCVFEHIYFSRPDSTVFGESVDEIRRRCGAVLGQESPVDADFVCSVPDSSNTATLGYAQQTGLPFELGLIRNHYVGRTFISPAQKVRDMSVRIKFNPVQRILTGKRVVLVDDSIVRGTTMRKLVKLIRAAGAAEVHLRIASPPITHPCYYGIDTPVRNELIASSHSVDEIATYLRVDSLAYLSIEGLLKATGKPGHYCSACFDGRYPVPFESDFTKEIMGRSADTPEVGSPGGR